jgi:hypothetical protein
MVTNDECRITAFGTECYRDLIAALDDERIPYALAKNRSLLGSRRGVPAASDILLTLSSAGAFTALWQIIKNVLARQGAREIKVSLGGSSLTVKGHPRPEEEQLMQRFLDKAVRSLPPDAEAGTRRVSDPSNPRPRQRLRRPPE